MHKMPRRNFLKAAGAAIATLPIGAQSWADSPAQVPTGASTQPADKGRRPNILVFFTDDHGQWAQHGYGNSELVTPNMDRITASGTRMAQAFTPSPVCSPSRACFFTGRMPSQHGIHDWLEEKNGSARHPGLTGQTLISELLLRAGYYTGLVGKWHCGLDEQPKPGFDYWFSYWDSQYPHKGRQKFSNQGKLAMEDGHQSPYLTARAIEFLRKHRSDGAAGQKPFFLFVGYVDTHSPHESAPDDLVKRYESATFRDIPDETFPACHGRPKDPRKGKPADKPRELIEYYAAVSSIDREIGNVLAELEATGELANTLVVYTGDHGLNTCHHGMWEKGNGTVPQNFLEESVRVPCALSWPAGGIRQNATCDDLVNHCDLWATLLDVAGASPAAATAEQINSPGVSYLRQLRGTADPSWRRVIISEYGNARMARDMRYKLIRRYAYNGVRFSDELYDLENDARETINRINDPQLATAIEKLSAELDRFFGKYTVAGQSGLDLDHKTAMYPVPIWAAT
jgi:arylsulfatase A-like enzyme